MILKENAIRNKTFMFGNLLIPKYQIIKGILEESDGHHDKMHAKYDFSFQYQAQTYDL